MVARTYSATLVGLEAIPIEVEVDGSAGTPNLIFVGLPSRAVDEAKDRVTSALINSGYRIRSKRTVVNLAPASLKKSDSGLELAIAIAILKLYGEISNQIDTLSFFGELSLDGSIRPIKGMLPLVQSVVTLGFRQLIVPRANAAEASNVPKAIIYPAAHLKEVVNHCNQTKLIQPSKMTLFKAAPAKTTVDFKDIFGQTTAKRVLEIAAAGGHNVLLIGPPGAGKTMLAQAVAGILPPLTQTEAIEVTNIFSIAGLLNDHGLCAHRPFRSPHHSISVAGLVGGGSTIRPGEISLAHRGVLFLDELPEFTQAALDALRQPLEDGHITITRALGSVKFPAQFMLVTAANPCPCGFALSQHTACRCTPSQKHRYLKSISGPIMDRIDLQLLVPFVPSHELKPSKYQENSHTVLTRVIAARERQRQRWKEAEIQTNHQATFKLLKKQGAISTTAIQLLRQAVTRLQLSTRTYVKMLRLARTIADLEPSTMVKPNHVAEALQYRTLPEN